MGKFFVPPTAKTPADRVREALDRAERYIPNLRKAGPQALALLHLLDQIAQGLVELEATGTDMRAERVRFETIQRQLRHRQSRFLAEVSTELREERAAVQPDPTHWWWFIDEAVAEQRRQQLRRVLKWGLAGLLLLAIAWVVYDRFIAPPPQVRQAIQHTTAGEALIEQRDLRAALAEFEAAITLTPDDPDPWLWKGAIHSELNEQDQAQAAFDTARDLYETDFDFLLSRALVYLRIGNLEAANSDAEQAIAQDPQAGRGYYIRASIAAELGDCATAIADLERASDLAHAAGDAQLEAAARTQLAMVMQMCIYQQPTLSPSDD